MVFKKNVSCGVIMLAYHIYQELVKKLYEE